MSDVEHLFLWSQALFKAGEEKFGTDEQSFVTILGNRSAEHLRKGLPELKSLFNCLTVSQGSQTHSEPVFQCSTLT